MPEEVKEVYVNQLPAETVETLDGTESLVGFDSVEGKQIPINALAGYVASKALITLNGSSQTVKAAIDSIGSSAGSSATALGTLETTVSGHTTQLGTISAAVTDIQTRLSSAEKRIEWGTVADALRTGQRPYAIGDTFSEPWKDVAADVTYNNPWRVNHYETVETEGGVLVPGMWLQNVYTLPFGVMFSHNRGFLRCPNGLSAGTYYVIFGSAWGSKGADANTAWNFTLTKDVEEGGCLAGFYSLPDVAPSTFKVYAYKADRKTVNETVSVASGVSGTLLGTLNLNTRNGDLNSMQETGYGWNNYRYSAMRQFLNSEGGVGEWWTPQDDWDVAPTELATKAGFLSGLPRGFIDSLVPAKITTYQNTVQDGGTATVLYDKVTIPSLSQMYVTNGNLDEGEAHSYYEQLNGTETKYGTGSSNVYPELIQHDVSTQAAVHARLRSASRGTAHTVYSVYSSGYVTNCSAATAHRPAPLVFIG